MSTVSVGVGGDCGTAPDAAAGAGGKSAAVSTRTTPATRIAASVGNAVTRPLATVAGTVMA